MENYIFGIRAVIEAINSGNQIDKILIKKDLTGNDLSAELFSLVKERNIYVQRVPLEKLNRITRKNHQGVIAFIPSVDYYRLDRIIPELYEQGIVPLIVVLDGITDVRNFGAIARTCECAGVNAIVIPERGSVSVGADAIKTSAGALMTLPVCREKNPVSAVKFLKENGYRIICATEKSTINYTKANYTLPTAIVMGAEDTGISGTILRMSDDMVSIPQFGTIGSLNVSVASGIIIYEAVRQRINSGMSVE